MNFKKRLTLENLLTEIFSVSIIFIAIFFLRGYKVDSRPGYEWDEPVYTQIETNYEKVGYPTLKSEGDNPPNQSYLYHPPFDFWLRSQWYKLTGLSGVGGGRVLSVIVSGFSFLILFKLFRELTSKKVAFISLILIATDGWLIYTNRLNLIENIMIPIGIGAMAVYVYATQKRTKLLYGISGLLLGFTVIYKHTGLYFLLIPIFYLLFTRRDLRRHLTLFACAASVIVFYVLAMYGTWGNIYVDQTLVQVKRALGIMNSRGLNYSVTDAVNAIARTYWIYFSTILALVLGSVVVIKNGIKFLLTREEPDEPLLLSWSISSLLFLLGISLKAPQYLVIYLVPIYIYLTVEFLPWITYQKKHTLLYIFVSLILLLNGTTWYIRFVKNNDNALLETYNYINTNLPENAVILTEESIGVGIKQKYYKFDLHSYQSELSRIKPDYIVTYSSSTQKLPTSPDLVNLINKSKEINQIKGFKETIRIYKS